MVAKLLYNLTIHYNCIPRLQAALWSPGFNMAAKASSSEHTCKIM